VFPTSESSRRDFNDAKSSLELETVRLQNSGSIM
jgi:hypothetical protein